MRKIIQQLRHVVYTLCLLPLIILFIVNPNAGWAQAKIVIIGCSCYVVFILPVTIVSMKRDPM